MATRWTVGKVQEDGVTVRSVYGHWDGYPAHAGKMLRDFYSDEDKLDRLLDMGDISSIDQQIGSPTERNDFDYRTEGMTTFYNRDRGELMENVGPLIHENVDGWLEYRKGSWCEYGYLRVNGEWQTFKITGEN
jgi:hypothetical protein